MKPIEFSQQNMVFKGPKDSGIMDIPAFNDGEKTVCCWEVSAEEAAQIAKTGKVWLSVYAGRQFPPVSVSATAPFLCSPEVNAWITYRAVVDIVGGPNVIRVLNAVDLPAPLKLKLPRTDRTFEVDRSVEIVRWIGEPFEQGMFYLRPRKTESGQVNAENVFTAPVTLAEVRQIDLSTMLPRLEYVEEVSIHYYEQTELLRSQLDL